MPELPEVETVRRVLDARLSGRKLLALDVPGEKSFYRVPDLKALRRVAVGRRLNGVGRRGKYLLLDFEGRSVVLHLGMSGRLVFEARTPHARLRLRFEGEDGVLSFDDPRRFGFAVLKSPDIGPEPLDESFRPEDLRRILSGRKAAVHSALMDQKALAGVGNIYATEALAAAGVRPQRRAASLTRAEVSKLYHSVREVLRLGIETRGSTLKDGGYQDPLGQDGSMQERIAVYGRDTCRRCRGPVSIARRALSGRTARYCPRCQK